MNENGHSCRSAKMQTGRVDIVEQDKERKVAYGTSSLSIALNIPSSFPKS